VCLLVNFEVLLVDPLADLARAACDLVVGLLEVGVEGPLRKIVLVLALKAEGVVALVKRLALGPLDHLLPDWLLARSWASG